MADLVLNKEDHPDKLAAVAGIDPKYLWMADDIQAVVNAINGRVERSEFIEQQSSPSGVIHLVQLTQGKNTLSFVAALTELHSVQSTVNYPGKVLVIKNRQALPITLVHMSEGVGVFESGVFYLPESTGYVLQPNSFIVMHWTTRNRYEVVSFVPGINQVLYQNNSVTNGQQLNFIDENNAQVTLDPNNISLLDLVQSSGIILNSNIIQRITNNGTNSVGIVFEDPTGMTGASAYILRDIGEAQKYIAFLDEVEAAQTAAENYADGLFDTIIGTSPAALDTLQEIATALQNNPNIVTEILTSLGNRLRFDVNNQGLSSTEKANALTNLGIVLADILNRANHTGTQAISTITGLLSELNCRPKIIALTNNPPSTHTGNTNTTVLLTVPIPANTFIVGDRFVIEAQASQTIVSNSQFNLEVYIDASPSPIEICRFRTSLSTNTFIGGSLSVEVLAGNLVRIRELQTVTDTGAATTGYITATFNPTVSNNLLFAVKLGNSANTVKLERVKVTKESI